MGTTIKTPSGTLVIVMIYSLRFFTACCYFGSFIVIYFGSFIVSFIVSYFGSFIVRSVRAVSGVVGPWGL